MAISRYAPNLLPRHYACQNLPTASNTGTPLPQGCSRSDTASHLPGHFDRSTSIEVQVLGQRDFRIFHCFHTGIRIFRIFFHAFQLL